MRRAPGIVGGGSSATAGLRSGRRAFVGAAWSVACGLALVACADRASAPVALEARAESAEHFGELVPFERIDSSGRAVSKADLAGRIRIASFVFTTCNGPCPTICANLRAIQGELPPSGVGRISSSVDPAVETPAVRVDYARALGAELARWLCSTGAAPEIDAFIRSSFALSVERAVPGSVPVGERVTHSTKLVMIDTHGGVAGYSSGTEPAAVREALQRATWLGAHGG